eukprot:CAMPEP_0119512604 /NCGR_PEP_ID=MMETSP1344-20130328/30943_1 /TAXON_ID=236787 /ORGANISM="Florenciella parvula, Strain CCMP2471" /LENGTH=224 /DNA_ID=CAMNT_0007549741 /DNA_START=156 /DNA_END=826 /DNA_ORIENTATION=-
MSEMDVVAADETEKEKETALTDEELTRIAKVLDDLKHEQVAERIAATGQLVTIASALGAERTRDELLPFLVESTDDEDEVLVVMADQLGMMVGSVGGAQHAHALLVPLERLAVVEETSVREKAVASLTTIAKVIDAHQIVSFWLPLVKDLTNHDYFTARISACALFSAAYATTSPSDRQELREGFARLCSDDTPMVRRVAASNLGTFAETVYAASDKEPGDGGG